MIIKVNDRKTTGGDGVANEYFIAKRTWSFRLFVVLSEKHESPLRYPLLDKHEFAGGGGEVGEYESLKDRLLIKLNTFKEKCGRRLLNSYK